MKKDIHPKNYRFVIFQDISNGAKFLIKSVVETTEKEKWSDGKEYPLYKIEVSSASHPFFTGSGKIMKARGRVERFTKRTEAASSNKK